MNRTTRKDLQGRCQAVHQRMTEELHAQLEDDGMRGDYAFTLLLRLVFAYFLQQHGLLDGDANYLQNRLARCRSAGQPFCLFLACLTYWGFGTPAEERTSFVRPLLGRVPYLSGSLFSPHPSELLESGNWTIPELPDELFEEALAFLQRYRWTLVEGVDGKEDEGVVTPAILGTLAEYHVEDRKRTGAYYTPVEICTYIVRETCEPLILKQFEQLTGRHCDSVDQLLDRLDERECALLLYVILPTLSLLDPACGACDFLVVTLDRITDIYRRVIERAQVLGHSLLDGWIAELDGATPCREFGLRKRVACRNLYGVDIQQSPLEAAKLRLALNLLKCAPKGFGGQLPLPNLEYRLPRGNSLVGLDRIAEREQAILASIHPGYDGLVEKWNTLTWLYHSAIGGPSTLAALRAEIDDCRASAYQSLNQVLLRRVAQSREKPGSGRSASSRRSDFTLDSLQRLEPFHYAFDFDRVMNRPFWARLDPSEAEVVQVDGRFTVRFGPDRPFAQ